MRFVSLPRYFSNLSTKKYPVAIPVAVLVALTILPLFGIGNYLLHISALVFVYVALGFGLNIVVGLTGLLDLGYIGFYAVGAYGYALLTSRFDLGFVPAALVSTLLAAVVGVILGWPTIRTRGDYLALVTLGFGEMIRLLARNWVTLTNGPQGLMNVRPPALGQHTINTPTGYYYAGLVLAVVIFGLFGRIKGSAVGQLLTAVRDDEESADAVGIDPVRWKLYAFALGAWVAGLAGVFFASWQRFVSPESFSLNESILVLCIVVLAGSGGAWSIVAAAGFLVLLPEALRGLASYRGLVSGLMLVSIVILQERVAARRRRLRPQPQHDQDSVLRPEFQQVDRAELRSERSNDTVLVIRKLSKAFGGVQALHEIDLAVRSREITGIVGANGAGKTTLFNCIAGSISPDDGDILLACSGVLTPLDKGLSSHKRARLGIMRTFQQPRLFSSLTALGNIEVAARCQTPPRSWEPFLRRGKSGVLSASRLRGYLASVGAPGPAKKVTDMSFVEQKLTELGRALATNPRVLLVDEPAAGLAPEGRRRLASVLEMARRSGITVVVVEHDLEFLQKICDRAVVMREGRIVADGKLYDVEVVEAIRESYSPGYKA